MKTAYVCALEAEWSRATENYTEALAHAASEASIFEKWLAANGRAQAASRWRTRDSTKGPSKTDLAQYYSEVMRIEEHPVVRSWKERARRYSDDIKNQQMERNRVALRDREYDVRRFSFSNVPYFLWRWWRDLAALWAPPWLQAGYLEPILQGESLERADKELKLRLQLETRLTPDWLRDVVDSPDIQPAARLEVHASLCATVRSVCLEGSRTEKVGALAVLPTVVEAATLSDLKWIEAFLIEAQHSLQGWVETPRGASMPAGAAAACWRALVAILPGHDAVSALAKAMAGLSIPGLQSLRRNCNRLSWYAWQLMGVTPEQLTTVIMARVEETREGLEDYDVAAMSVAAAEVLSNARTLQQHVPKVVLESLRDWLAFVTAFPARTWSRPEVLGAAAYLWTELERSDAGIVRELITQIMDRCLTAPSEGNRPDDENPICPLECRARVLSDLLSNEALENVPEEAQRLVADLMASWPSIRRHCEANHGDVWPFSQFLIAKMRRGADGNAAWVREAVLDLMAIS